MIQNLQLRRTFLFLHVALLFLNLDKACAQDSTIRKNPFFLSVGAGYASNSVYGTMADHILTYWYPTGGKLHMENGGSFMIQIQGGKYISSHFYIASGLNYIVKKVNPMEETIVVYRDSLNTGYLSVPLLFGANLFPVNKSAFNAFLEFGPVANFKVSDKSYAGPDRVGFKTSPLTLSICPGVGISLSASPTQKFILQYQFMYDLTNAYVETLYMSQDDPNHDYAYKYKTHIFSFTYRFLFN